MVLLQAEPVTRPTFWLIGPVGKAIFYYLAAVAILVFLVGIYQRVTRYVRGTADPFPRLDDLSGRVRTAARLALSNARQLDRDPVAGLMHAAIVWGFLTLLIGTTIFAIDIDLYRPLTGESFFVGEFYRSYSLVMDALGLFFVAGIGVALSRRYVTLPHVSAGDTPAARITSFSGRCSCWAWVGTPPKRSGSSDRDSLPTKR